MQLIIHRAFNSEKKGKPMPVIPRAYALASMLRSAVIMALAIIIFFSLRGSHSRPMREVATICMFFAIGSEAVIVYHTIRYRSGKVKKKDGATPD